MRSDFMKSIDSSAHSSLNNNENISLNSILTSPLLSSNTSHTSLTSLTEETSPLNSLSNSQKDGFELLKESENKPTVLHMIASQSPIPHLIRTVMGRDKATVSVIVHSAFPSASSSERQLLKLASKWSEVSVRRGGGGRSV
eukprot:GHVN01101477.1.p1 GENE.GHVN01101477.1~~GHVN01101477.1.p1  ORF type:complete len:141 (+),score=54.96 GHVN01101477.1:322-744(+)